MRKRKPVESKGVKSIPEKEEIELLEKKIEKLIGELGSHGVYVFIAFGNKFASQGKEINVAQVIGMLSFEIHSLHHHEQDRRKNNG